MFNLRSLGRAGGSAPARSRRRLLYSESSLGIGGSGGFVEAGIGLENENTVAAANASA